MPPINTPNRPKSHRPRRRVHCATRIDSGEERRIHPSNKPRRIHPSSNKPRRIHPSSSKPRRVHPSSSSSSKPRRSSSSIDPSKQRRINDNDNPQIATIEHLHTGERNGIPFVLSVGVVDVFDVFEDEMEEGA